MSAKYEPFLNSVILKYNGKYSGFVGGDMIFHVISSVTVTTESKTCDQNAEPAKPFQSTAFLGKRSERETKFK